MQMAGHAVIISGCLFPLPAPPVQAGHLCQPWGCSQTFFTFQGQHTLTDEHPGQNPNVSKAAATRPESMCKQRAFWERMNKRKAQGNSSGSGRDGKLLSETWIGHTHASTS